MDGRASQIGRVWNWWWILSYRDRIGVWATEVFPHEPDAVHRAQQLRSAGFYEVRIKQRRALPHGQPTWLRNAVMAARPSD